MFGKKKKDDKIRVRCRECGKKLKLPANEPGRVFRCPICSSTVIAPLQVDPSLHVQKAGPSPEGGTSGGRMSLDDVESVFSRADIAKGIGHATGWRPQIKSDPENKSINDLVNFLNRENERVRDVAVSSLQDANATPEQQARRLASLRKEKNQRLRAEIDKILERLDDEIRAMSKGANMRNAEVRSRLEKKHAEKRELLAYLQGLFGLKLADTQGENPLLE